MRSWTVAEAKAKFSKMLDEAAAGMPQVITRNGKQTAIIVSIAEWERKTQRVGSLVDFFAASPLREVEIPIERAPDESRSRDIL